MFARGFPFLLDASLVKAQTKKSYFFRPKKIAVSANFLSAALCATAALRPKKVREQKFFFLTPKKGAEKKFKFKGARFIRDYVIFYIGANKICKQNFVDEPFFIGSAYPVPQRGKGLAVVNFVKKEYLESFTCR